MWPLLDATLLGRGRGRNLRKTLWTFVSDPVCLPWEGVQATRISIQLPIPLQIQKMLPTPPIRSDTPFISSARATCQTQALLDSVTVLQPSPFALIDLPCPSPFGISKSTGTKIKIKTAASRKYSPNISERLLGLWGLSPSIADLISSTAGRIISASRY